MKFTIDLLPRYQSAFGFVGSRFVNNVGVGTAVSELESKLFHRFSEQSITPTQQAQKFTAPVFYKTSDFCFADLHLKNSAFEIKLGDFNQSIKSAGGNAFVAPPMISTSRSKIIPVTTPDRGEGEVVENFSKKSYEITLKGLIVDMQNHLYPSSQVKLLRQFFDINGVFDVVSCPLLTDLGIHALYLTDWDDLSGVEGFEDTMSYSFKARSFQPVEFLQYGQ